MSYSSRQIDREVFSAVAETCPKVDEALEKAADAIKKNRLDYCVMRFESMQKGR